MKKNLIASYITGIRDTAHGESYWSIIRYFLPELVTASLVAVVPILEAYLISSLSSTQLFATHGSIHNFIHLVIKLAEGVCVGTVILSGQFNGRAEYSEVGRTLRDSFWTACLVGLSIASFLYFGADSILSWYGVPNEIITPGIPYLRMRAVGVIFMFIYYAFVGFLRGIKNTKTPMQIFIAGSLVVILFDYLLIFGNFGFPVLGLQGAAVASVIQYLVMTLLALGYVLGDAKNRKYGFVLIDGIFTKNYIKDLFILSWPIILDKATLACAYIWLSKMVNAMGTCAMASCSVIQSMERFALLPALAFAQVITFLVSNDFGAQHWESVKSNTKKVVFLATFMVLSILMILSLWPSFFIGIFDKKHEFTEFAARIFPVISALAFFDLLQLILSGALRGASNVKVIMITRLVVILCFFVPVSYMFARMPMQDQVIKFILIYGSFYVGNALMNIVYINRFRTDKWKMRS